MIEYFACLLLMISKENQLSVIEVLKHPLMSV